MFSSKSSSPSNVVVYTHTLRRATLATSSTPTIFETGKVVLQLRREVKKRKTENDFSQARDARNFSSMPTIFETSKVVI